MGADRSTLRVSAWQGQIDMTRPQSLNRHQKNLRWPLFFFYILSPSSNHFKQRLGESDNRYTLLEMIGVIRPSRIGLTTHNISNNSPRKLFQIQSSVPTRTFIDSFLSSALGPCPLRSLTHTKTIPYSSKVVFKAVSDVSGYPGFLPFTISSNVTARDNDGYPTRAKLKVGYAKLGLEEDWDSLVNCNAREGIVEARSSENNSQGLFEVLTTKWKIDALSEGGSGKSSVKLDVDVKFKNPMYDQMFAQVEEKVANAMISAFEKRVQELEQAC